MNALTISTGRLDRLAVGLSGLCLVHCLATTVALALLSAAGGFFGAPIIHEIGLSLAMIMGAIALGPVIGVAILALGHRLNAIAAD
jgi:MerC mercury resistance protein